MEKQLKKINDGCSNLRLRPYKTCDAKTIVTWIHDEISLRKWSADRYEAFPVTEEDMNKKYMECNGDCSKRDDFYPMTAFDESGVVGHLIMRFTDEEKQVLRFGFVIVDDAKRGKGYGKQMLLLAIKYAFDILKAAKVTLGVFENNEAAYYCYKAAGFKEIALEKEEYYSILGQKWKCIEMEIDAGFLWENERLYGNIKHVI
ncbi:MAG: GNAT family N-acetyltransferase [Lachnospiraceae bacterium]|nr:GNAT family N-acetyltransferase [Lachnospiraceae bacterium]